MRPLLRSPSTIAVTALLSLLLSAAQSRSLLYPPTPSLPAPAHAQAPLVAMSALFPPSTASAAASSEPPQPQGDLTISDVISLDASIKIFADITRSVPSIATLFETRSANVTVLAPTNKAIGELDRKPWEDPPSRDGGEKGASLVGKAGDDRAQENLRRFVDAHIVAQRPWEEGKEIKRGVNGDGGKVWWKQPDGRRFIYPENVEVEKITQTVVNGEVWVLKGVVNYA